MTDSGERPILALASSRALPPGMGSLRSSSQMALLPTELTRRPDPSSAAGGRSVAGRLERRLLTIGLFVAILVTLVWNLDFYTSLYRDRATARVHAGGPGSPEVLVPGQGEIGSIGATIPGGSREPHLAQAAGSEGPVRILDPGTGLVLLEGQLADGVKSGLWREFHPGTAIVFQEGNYEGGRRQGQWKRYYPGGSLHEEGSFVDGLRDGPWSVFHETGVLMKEGSYRAGHREGVWILRDSMGVQRERGEYRDGLREGYWEFRSRGGDLDSRTGYYRRGLRERRR